MKSVTKVYFRSQTNKQPRAITVRRRMKSKNSVMSLVCVMAHRTGHRALSGVHSAESLRKPRCKIIVIAALVASRRPLEIYKIFVNLSFTPVSVQ